MNAEHLSGDDPRYVWDADFGGELDVVDYGYGRFTFEGNYQVVLGEEIRSFDPNQGNYILAGNVSARTRWFEVTSVVAVLDLEFSETALVDARFQPSRLVGRRWGE